MSSRVVSKGWKSPVSPEPAGREAATGTVNAGAEEDSASAKDEDVWVRSSDGSRLSLRLGWPSGFPLEIWRVEASGEGDSLWADTWTTGVSRFSEAGFAGISAITASA